MAKEFKITGSLETTENLKIQGKEVATKEWVNGVITGKVDYLGSVGSSEEVINLINSDITPSPGDYFRALNNFDFYYSTKGQEMVHAGDILIFSHKNEDNAYLFDVICVDNNILSEDNLWTGFNQFSLTNTTIGKMYSADEPYFVRFADDGMLFTAMKAEQGGDAYWIPSIKLTTMGPPIYTEYKSDKIIYEILGQDCSRLHSELIFPKGKTGTIALLEHMNLENGEGSGSVQQKESVYNEKSIVFNDGTKGTQQGDTIPGAEAKGYGAVALGGLRYDYYTSPETHAENLKIDSTSTENWGRTPTSAEGNQSFAAGGSVHAYGNFSVAMSKDAKAYQGCGIVIGAGKAGMTEEEFNAHWWDSTNNKPLNSGKGKDDQGNILDFEGKSYSKSYSFGVSLGCANEARGVRSVAIGDGNIATGQGAVAIGVRGVASGTSAIALNSDTKATGKDSFAAGNQTEATNGQSVAFGNKTKATGARAAVFGDQSIAQGADSLAIGYKNKALGNKSFALGANTTTYGEASFAGGYGSVANGSWAHAWGEWSKAVGKGATTFGYGTQTGTIDSNGNILTSNDYMMAVGINNNLDEDIKDNTVFSVGTGVVGGARSTGFKVTKDGQTIAKKLITNEVYLKSTNNLARISLTDAGNLKFTDMHAVNTIATQEWVQSQNIGFTPVTINPNETEAGYLFNFSATDDFVFEDNGVYLLEVNQMPNGDENRDVVLGSLTFRGINLNLGMPSAHCVCWSMKSGERTDIYSNTYVYAYSMGQAMAIVFNTMDNSKVLSIDPANVKLTRIA